MAADSVLNYDDIEDIRYDPFSGTYTPKKIGYGAEPVERRTVPASPPYQIKLFEIPQENIPSTTRIVISAGEPGAGTVLREVAFNQIPGNNEYRVAYNGMLGAGIVEYNSAQADIQTDIQYYGLGSINQKISLDSRVPASGNTSIAGIKTFTDTTDSTTKDTGAIICEGGIGIEKKVYVGTDAHIGNDIYIGQDVNVGKFVYINSPASQSPSTGSISTTIDTGLVGGDILWVLGSNVDVNMAGYNDLDICARIRTNAGVGIQEGGLIFKGYTAGEEGIEYLSYVVSVDTTLGTGAVGSHEFNSYKIAAGAEGSLGNDDNMFVIKNNNSTKFIIKGDGDYFTDSAGAGGAGTGDYTPRYYDNENDIMLSNALRKQLGAKYEEFKKNKNLAKYRDKLEKLGIMRNGFISGKGMMALNLGTLHQLWNIIKNLAKKLNITEEKLFEFAKDYKE